MEKIHSFTIDHSNHEPGLYLSGIKQNIYTYDLRFKVPNAGDYLEYASIHSIEHIMATVLRNGKQKEKIIYFGPMGCRTGFYLLVEDLELPAVRLLLEESIDCAVALEELPGSDAKECGNYLEHDFETAKRDLQNYKKHLKI